MLWEITSYLTSKDIDDKIQKILHDFFTVKSLAEKTQGIGWIKFSAICLFVAEQFGKLDLPLGLKFSLQSVEVLVLNSSSSGESKNIFLLLQKNYQLIKSFFAEGSLGNNFFNRMYIVCEKSLANQPTQNFLDFMQRDISLSSDNSYLLRHYSVLTRLLPILGGLVEGNGRTASDLARLPGSPFAPNLPTQSLTKAINELSQMKR